jgi:pimeloyl-ACP methyl ester carboxylesterase
MPHPTFLNTLPARILSIPIKNSPHEATLILPLKPSDPSPSDPSPPHTPWVLYAPAQGFAPCNLWITQRLLQNNIALAMLNVGESAGSPTSTKLLTSLHQTLTTLHNLAQKPVLWPQSRGGLTLYNFAIQNPHLPAAIAGTYTVTNLEDWTTSQHPRIKDLYHQALQAYHQTHDQFIADLPKNNPHQNLAPLAKQKIPLLHLHGTHDQVVPLKPHAQQLTTLYQSLNAPATLILAEGKGHEESPAFFQSLPFLDFIIHHATHPHI